MKARSCIVVNLLKQNRYDNQAFEMNKITQNMKFCQSILKYGSA